jgi:DNA mismatch repair ATPase MutL
MIDKPKTLADYTRSVSQTSPLTTADRLQRIETLGKRIDAHVQSICQVGSLNGTSTETPSMNRWSCWSAVWASSRTP